MGTDTSALALLPVLVRPLVRALTLRNVLLLLASVHTHLARIVSVLDLSRVPALPPAARERAVPLLDPALDLALLMEAEAAVTRSVNILVPALVLDHRGRAPTAHVLRSSPTALVLQ